MRAKNREARKDIAAHVELAARFTASDPKVSRWHMLKALGLIVKYGTNPQRTAAAGVRKTLLETTK